MPETGKIAIDIDAMIVLITSLTYNKQIPAEIGTDTDMQNLQEAPTYYIIPIMIAADACIDITGSVQSRDPQNIIITKRSNGKMSRKTECGKKYT